MSYCWLQATLSCEWVTDWMGDWMIPALYTGLDIKPWCWQESAGHWLCALCCVAAGMCGFSQTEHDRREAEEEEVQLLHHTLQLWGFGPTLAGLMINGCWLESQRDFVFQTKQNDTSLTSLQESHRLKNFYYLLLTRVVLLHGDGVRQRASTVQSEVIMT